MSMYATCHVRRGKRKGREMSDCNTMNKVGLWVQCVPLRLTGGIKLDQRQ